MTKHNNDISAKLTGEELYRGAKYIVSMIKYMVFMLVKQLRLMVRKQCISLRLKGGVFIIKYVVYVINRGGIIK